MAILRGALLTLAGGRVICSTGNFTKAHHHHQIVIGGPLWLLRPPPPLRLPILFHNFHHKARLSTRWRVLGILDASGGGENKLKRQQTFLDSTAGVGGGVQGGLHRRYLMGGNKLFVEVDGTSSSTANNITTNSPSQNEHVEVIYFRGLPQFTIPLPSRRASCRFIVKPLSNTVGDLLTMIQHEDKGIDRITFLSTDGIRIASSNTIEMLMENDFDMILNEKVYRVKTPPQEKPSQEDLTRLSSVRNLVGQLYGALNVDEHQLRQEREMIIELEKLKGELIPLEDKREQINELALKRTNKLTWIGLGLMSVQFGVLARLTWFEYSWDIMEPVTYFVTYGTAMLAYAYFVLTKQEYVLPQVADRQYLITFHKNAKKVGLDVNKYNKLRDQIHKIETDLSRLRDPLALHLPLKNRLVTKQELDNILQSPDESSQSIVSKATQRIQQIFKKSSS